MQLHTTWIIAQKELRDSLRNRWLWLYTIAFAGLALALSSVGMAGAGYGGLRALAAPRRVGSTPVVVRAADRPVGGRGHRRT